MTDEHEHAMKVAEQAYSAGNLVTCDGYYEFDLDAATAVIAADRAGLVAEIERLRAITSKLADYAGHDEDCQIMTWRIGSDDPIPCTCGYSEIARAALKDTRND
jgi:hypothetical protein